MSRLDPLQPTTELLLHAYRNGIFPMGDPDTGEIRWYSAHRRALLPLDERFRVSRSLRRVVRSGRFVVTTDRAFDRVIAACAEAAPDRPTTWITPALRMAYQQLHRDGFAHSLESWQDGHLVGGLYGVAIGGAFFGESMFSRATDASKVALVHLVEHLRGREFRLLDIQFMTPHLRRFGAYDVSRDVYLAQLEQAVGYDARFADGSIPQTNRY